jgi:hypothetical protein
MSAAPQWRVVVVQASKARAVKRVWIRRGSEREGWYRNETVAQAECDRRNGA